MRNLLALSIAALAACSYDPETAAVTVHVDGIPQNADHLEVTLTDASAATFTRTPAFGAASTPSVDVVFPPPASGSFHVTIDAKDREGATLSQGSGDGAFPGQAALQVVLRSTGLLGTFGAPCNAAGGSSAQCLSGLECRVYQATDQGVCTRTCASASPDCNGVSPAAVCDPFPGLGTNYCQWDCTSSGQSGCPTGLTCRAAPNSGGKSYCQGT